MRDKYSYSKIDTYNQCPFKFKLKYVDGHYINAKSIALTFGSAIHAIEEDIAKCLMAKSKIDYTTLKNNLIIKSTELEKDFPKDYFELDKSNRTYSEKIYYYLEKSIKNLETFMSQNPDLEILGAEIPFEFNYDDTHYFAGKIDRAFRNTKTGDIYIQDIKTYAIPMKHDELTTPLQMLVYTLAAKELWNTPIEKIHCQYYLPLCEDLDTGKTAITHDAGTAGWIKRGTKKLDELFSGVKNEDWTPTPTPLCHWCEYCSTNPNAIYSGKFLCPYHSNWTKTSADFSKSNEWHGIKEHATILESYFLKNNVKKEYVNKGNKK